MGNTGPSAFKTLECSIYAHALLLNKNDVIAAQTYFELENVLI